MREVYHLGKGGSDFSCERKLAEAIVSIVEYVSARKDMLDLYLIKRHLKSNLYDVFVWSLT